MVKENLIFLQENTWTSIAMFLLMVVSVGCLLFDRNKEVRRAARYSAFMTIAVVYNYYLFNYVIGKVYDTGEKVQLRLFWVVPFFLLMAFFLVQINSLPKKRAVSVVAVFASIAFIRFAGMPFHPDVIVERSNWYKVNQEAIDTAELVEKEFAKSSFETLTSRPTIFDVSSTDVNDDISEGNQFYYGIRQYTSDFVLASSLIQPENYTAEGFDITNYYNVPSQYLICENGMEAVKNTAQQYGYHQFAKTENHLLLKYGRSATIYLAVRGQTKGDTSGELRGTSGNASLTTTGWWSALRLGRALQNIQFDYVYAADAGQSKITAAIVLKENKNRETIPAVTPYGLLNDITWGRYEGYKKTAVIASFGEAALDNGTPSDASFRSLLGAETKYNATNRFRNAMGDTVKRLESDGKTILVVANPSINWWLEREVENAEFIQPGEYVKLDYVNGIWSLAK